MRNAPLDDGALWEADYERQRVEFEKLNEPYERKRREEARLKAEQDAANELRRIELFVTKGTLAYSETLATEICERISVGELVIDICNDEHMPTMRRLNLWLKEHSDFAALHKESLNDRLSVFEEEVIKIADDASRDFKTITKHGRQVKVADPDMIARAKLRVEIRLKHLKAGRPEKWGEQSTIITKSVDDYSDLTAEELVTKLHELDKKRDIARKAA